MVGRVQEDPTALGTKMIEEIFLSDLERFHGVLAKNTVQGVGPQLMMTEPAESPDPRYRAPGRECVGADEPHEGVGESVLRGPREGRSRGDLEGGEFKGEDSKFPLAGPTNIKGDAATGVKVGVGVSGLAGVLVGMGARAIGTRGVLVAVGVVV